MDFHMHVIPCSFETAASACTHLQCMNRQILSTCILGDPCGIHHTKVSNQYGQSQLNNSSASYLSFRGQLLVLICQLPYHPLHPEHIAVLGLQDWKVLV